MPLKLSLEVFDQLTTDLIDGGLVETLESKLFNRDSQLLAFTSRFQISDTRTSGVADKGTLIVLFPTNFLVQHVDCPSKSKRAKGILDYLT